MTMTDPQTPATEAGRLDEMRRFHNGSHQVKDFCDACALIAMLPAIEAKARASLDDLRCTVCGDGAILGRDAVAVHDMCLVR